LRSQVGALRSLPDLVLELSRLEYAYRLSQEKIDGD
jgi:hypothetical protein